MDNFFSSAEHFDDLTKTINCFGTLRLNRQGMSEDRRCKTMKLRWHGIQVTTRGDFTAIHWMDKRDICLLINMLNPPQEGNFCDEQINAIKLDNVAVYSHHMGYADKGDSLTNSYSVSHWTWKWTKRLCCIY